MADKTDCRLTRDLMLEAVPCWREKARSKSAEVIAKGTIRFPSRGTMGLILRILQPTSWPLERLDPWELQKNHYVSFCWQVGRKSVGNANARMMREIMDVPFPLAASRRLMSFLIFQISIYRHCGQPVALLCLIAPFSSVLLHFESRSPFGISTFPPRTAGQTPPQRMGRGKLEAVASLSQPRPVCTNFFVWQ